MLIRLVVFGVTACFCFRISAVQAAPATLQDVVRSAIDTNPEIQAAWHELSMAEQDVRIASSGYRPRVDVSAGSSQVRRNYGLEPRYIDNQAQISVTQMLYDGFFTASEVKRLKAAKKVRYLELLNQIEQISLDVASAYADVLLYRELLKVSEANLKTHVDVYKQIEKSVKAGVARRADLEQISGRLSLAESNLMTEQSNLHDVSARFLRLTGFLPPSELMPIDELSDAEIADSADQSLLNAYKGNPGFLAAWYNVNAAQFGIESARSRYHPTLNLVGSYGTQSRDEAGIDISQTEGRIGLQFSMNLYNGGADRAAVRSAIYGTEQARDLRDQSCRDVRQTVQIAFNDIQNLTRQLPALNEHRITSGRVKTAYLDQFKIGNRTLLDLLDSENESYQSGRAYTEAVYTQYKAILRLLAGSGELARYLTVSSDKFELADTLTLSDAVYDPRYVCPPENINVVAAQTNILVRDSDGDGVTDLWDECPDTPPGTQVNEQGCAYERTTDSGALNVNAQAFEQEPVIEPATLTVTDPVTPPVNAPMKTLPAQQVKVVIPFGVNSVELDSRYTDRLKPVIAALNSDPSSGVVIFGHASLEGNSQYNMMLSVRRANSVASWIRANSDSDESRVSVVGRGVEEPLINAISPEANAANRRVETVVVTLNAPERVGE